MNNQVIKSNAEPLVSVVVCFFNEKLFLEEAIQSVFSQTYERWELLLVDDGSTDESTAMAKDYAATYPDKIRYVDHPYHQNMGVSASRNAGARKCNGSYIAFLDADDVWLPDKLSFQLNIFRDHPEVTVVVEPSLYWSSWKDEKVTDELIPVGVSEGIYRAPQLTVALYPLGQGAAPCPSSIMVQRAVLRRCSFEDMFRGILQMYEEQAFLAKVYLKETVYVSAVCHNRYRQRPNSLASLTRESGNYDRVRSYYLYWLRDYLLAQPVRYKSVQRLLRRAQMPYREPMLYKFIVGLPVLGRKLLHRLSVKRGFVNVSKSW